MSERLLGIKSRRKGILDTGPVAWFQDSGAGQTLWAVQASPPVCAERNSINFSTPCRRERERMSEQKFVNAMRITWKTHPLIKRHYFYFNIKWMLIFFSSLQPWLPVSSFLLFCLGKPNHTKPKTRHYHHRPQMCLLQEMYFHSFFRSK